MGSSDDERPSIHDRFNDDRRSHSSPKDFFRALGHSSKASGLGRRVYEQADKGSRHATEEYKDTTPWNGQVGERRQYEARPAPPQVPTTNSVPDVMNALGSNQQFDPHYAEAVLQSYVRGQLMMGRTNEEVGKDLEDLQARLGQYAEVGVFHNVRQVFAIDAPPAYGQKPPAYK